MKTHFGTEMFLRNESLLNKSFKKKVDTVFKNILSNPNNHNVFKTNKVIDENKI